jgi:hypothetical protein
MNNNEEPFGGNLGEGHNPFPEDGSNPNMNINEDPFINDEEENNPAGDPFNNNNEPVA